jgi:PIN domain nuclease of toxin-antitoxin system
LIDTQVLVWLYGGQEKRIPQAVQRRLNREQLGVSPFVMLELTYLHEIRRTTTPAQAVIEELGARLALVVADISTLAVCNAATGITWTRAPFDRLIAAHAVASGMTLVTRDELIRRHLPLAWWAD